MSGVLILIPVALLLGVVGLIAFLWSLRSGQFEDLETPAQAPLSDDEEISRGEKINECR